MSISAEVVAQVERQVLQVCSTAGIAGVPMEALKTQFGKHGQAFGTAMRQLLFTARKIEHFKKNGLTCYRLASDGPAGGMKTMKAAKLGQLRDIEKMCYEHVRTADVKGLWSKDLKSALKAAGHAATFSDATIDKALKRLEKENLIKKVKTIAHKNRSVFMLFELDPHASLTGGTWYEDQKFDREFVKLVYRAVFQYIREHDAVSIESLERAINNAQISRRNLTTDDIMAVVNILIYDGKLVEGTSGSGQYYQLATQIVDSSPFADVPCVTCPIQQQCDSSGCGPYNPQDCRYFTQWFEQ